MNDQTDSQLLRDYAQHGFEPAFAELVRRYVDLVYSAALRMVCDSHLAEDVTQGVFLALAKSATPLKDRPDLSGWLHRTARNIAAQTVRTEVRRRAREKEAAAMDELLSPESDAVWEQIAPHLDEALSELSEPDHDAVLLRYFERKSAREMAQTLGLSEEAAKKRVSRAVERLREFLAKRGISVGASALTLVISANAVQAAPVGLALTISTAVVLAGTTTTVATATTAIKIIAMTTLQKALLATTIIAAVATPLVMQHQSLVKLRAENESIRRELAGADQVAPVATAKPAPKLSDEQFNELLKLRGEVGVLRRQAAETAKQPEKIAPPVKQQPAEQSEAEQEKAAALQKQQFIAKMNYAKNWTLAFFMYADKNGGQFPTNFDQAIALLPDQARDETLLATNQFEIFYSGPIISQINNPQNIILIGETQAQPVKGGWVKTYGFADGHSEVHREADGNFEAWEKQHTISQP